MEEVSKKLESASVELRRAQDLCAGKKPLEGSIKLVNRIKSETRFLKKLKTGKKTLDASHVSSSNLKNLKAILDAITCIGAENIERILSPVTCYEESDNEDYEMSHSFTIDLVANSGHTWVKVIARKPSALLANACGKGEFGSRSLIDTGKMYLLAAKQNQTDYLKPFVVFYFADGVPSILAECLIAMGIVVNGKITSHHVDVSLEPPVLEDSSDEEEGADVLEMIRTKDRCACTDCEEVKESLKREPDLSICPFALTNILSYNCSTLKDLVFDIHNLRISCTNSSEQATESSLNHYASIEEANLDVTAMLALVSNLANGSANCRFNSKILKDHAAQERETPVLPALNAVLQNKELVACETAISAFNSIVSIIGGPKEAERANELLKRITVVPDSPSERCLSLPQTGKINKRALIIFGTGDQRKALTITSNSGFIRAALQSGVKLTTYEHQARVLTEMKELKSDDKKDDEMKELK